MIKIPTLMRSCSYCFYEACKYWTYK